MTTPIIAITMGDAAGVGPEIIMKALARLAAVHDLPPAGDRRCRTAAAGRAIVGAAADGLPVRDPQEAAFRPGRSTASTSA